MPLSVIIFGIFVIIGIIFFIIGLETSLNKRYRGQEILKQINKNKKSKSSIMKKIIKYVFYSIIVVLLIKIGIVLINYLPTQIELLLK